MRINGMDPGLAELIAKRIESLRTNKGLERFYAGQELETLQNNEEIRLKELTECEQSRDSFTPM